MRFFDFKNNNIASGFAVAMINIPLCLSLSIASWAWPMPWLLTWAWLGILMWFLWSSHHNIYAATGSLTAMLLPVSVMFWPEWFPVVWMISAVCMFAIYVLKLTKYITLIPSSALHGFMLWISLLIISTQVTNIFGLHDLPWYEWIWWMFTTVYAHIYDSNIVAVCVFVWATLFLWLWKKYILSFPWAIVVSIIGIAIWYGVSIWFFPTIHLLQDSYLHMHFLPIDFSWMSLFSGNIGSGVSRFALFAISLWVAVIAILETLISAKIATQNTKVSHDTSKEIQWLSIASLFTWIVWWLPGAGVVVRTGMNIKNGATHRTAWFIAWIGTLFVTWFFFDIGLAYMPFAIIAAILVDLACGMIDLSLYRKIRNYQKMWVIIVVIVASISLIYDPLVAIGVWTWLSLLVYLNQVMQSNNRITIRTSECIQHLDIHDIDVKDIPQDSIVRIRWAWHISYLTTEKLSSFLMHLWHVRAVILSLSATAHVDIDGLEMLEDCILHLDEVGTQIYFTWIRAPVRNMFLQSAFLATHLENHEYESTTEVVDTLGYC